MLTDVPDTLHTILAVVSFVFGTVVGSFLNVCVSRLPQGLSVVKPRSRCPKCENAIAWYDNIPIVSWLLLGAKCRNCGEPISWQYPLVEAVTGVLFVLIYLNFQLSVATPVYMLLGAALVLVTFVDLTDWTIPDEVTLPGAPVGLACSVLAMVFPESGLLVDNPFDALLGVLAGGGVLYGLDFLSLVLLNKRGMGFGDVKLAAMIGAFFGVSGVLLTIILAAVFGSIVGVTVLAMQGREGGEKKSRAHYLPFGPYLVLGALLHMFFGQAIIDTYLEYLTTPGALT